MKLKDLHNTKADPIIVTDPEAEHDALDRKADIASDLSMDCSDPAPFNPGTAAPNNMTPPHDERLKPGKPISSHP